MPNSLINHKSDPIPIFFKNIHYKNQFWSTQNKAPRIVLYILQGGYKFFHLAMYNTNLKNTNFLKFQI